MRKLQLAGRRFGKLIAIEPTQRPHDVAPNASVYWLCNCDCGGTAVRRSDVLASGHIKTCGCGRLRSMPVGSAALPMPDRFWSAVDKTDGCWNWTAARLGSGYGSFSRGRGTPNSGAHRVAWELTNGPVPSSIHVLHRCDNPICVRPDHLFLGTNKDNVDDKVAKGRQSRMIGERNPNAKLNTSDVEEIRRRHHSGQSATAIASRYGMGQTQISRIIRRETWKTNDG